METTKLNQSNDNKSKFKLEYNQNITKCKKEDTGLYMHKSTLNIISPIWDILDKICEEQDISASNAINYLLCHTLPIDYLISEKQLESIISIICKNSKNRYIEFESLLNTLINSSTSINDYYNFFMNYGFPVQTSNCLSILMHFKIDFKILLVSKLQEKIKIEFNVNTYVHYPTYNINNDLSSNNLLKITDEFIKENPKQILNVVNPSKDLLYIAFEQDNSLLEYFDYLDLDTQLYFINKNPENIKYMKNPHESIQLIAVNNDANLIKYIKNPTSTVQLLVLQKDKDLIKYIKKPDNQVKTILNIK